MNVSSSADQAVRIECDASLGFQAWLAEAGGSLAVSTYQAGKVALIGWDGRQVTLLMRQFDKPLGMAAVKDRILLATRHDFWMFANANLLAPDFLEDQPGRYDALYLPRATYHTGDLNTHDVAMAGDDVLLVATRFSCLARLSTDFNFTPVWKPRFVTDLVPEDRCHLNGLAMRDGRPRYVTALGTTDVAGTWREKKASGGVLIDVQSDEILVGGLAMPHSPRWHGGRLWLLNSGAGELLVVDAASGQTNVVCRLPGYLRGLCFLGTYAILGLSKIREKHIFGGLPVQNRCEKLQCGVAVVDTRTGGLAGLFEFTAGCEELYDVQFLPGVYRPMILNLDKPAARQAMTNPESSFWLRAGSEIRDLVGK
ncbi:MAG: TIGR03032 family protein [Thermoguttaceae bacterium]|jgi:uncharacterized protein (TIGR03032 family)